MVNKGIVKSRALIFISFPQMVNNLGYLTTYKCIWEVLKL